jgi:hypothetical protein
LGLPAGDIAGKVSTANDLREHLHMVYEEASRWPGPVPSIAGAYSVDELFVEANAVVGHNAHGEPGVGRRLLLVRLTTGFDTQHLPLRFRLAIIDPRASVSKNSAVRAQH